MNMLKFLNYLKIDYFIYFIIIIVFFSYSFFNFLFVEDSIVYFNRSNYLSANIFFFYNGHIQIYPQLISYLVSGFSPVLQVTVYSLYALLCFIFFTYLLGKLIEDKKVLFLLICYICCFFTVIIYNLANTNWTGLLITAIFPIIIFRKNNNMSLKEFFIILFFSLSNLLSILTVSIFLYCFYKSKFKDIKIILVILWIIFFSFLMVNFSSDRSNLFQNLINNFLFIVNNFDSFFIPNFNLLSDYPTRITELISFLGLIVLIYIVLNSNLGKYFKIEFLSLISFCISILILAFLSIEVNSFYVGPRYFFAIIVVFAIYFSYFSSKFRHLLIISCFFAFSLIPITVYIRYYESFNKNKDFFYHSKKNFEKMYSKNLTKFKQQIDNKFVSKMSERLGLL